jgi:DNA invertase Pin-like site-specific DNA recombinase
MSAVAYLRAVRGSDDLDEQRAAVTAWAMASGITITDVYRDGPRRGTAGRAALLREVDAGRVRHVIVARPCRLAPTLHAVLSLLHRLDEAGVSVVAANAPEAFATLLAGFDALAAVRAGQHKDAVAAGLERARREGTSAGRPPVEPERIGRVRDALLVGASVRQAARAGGIGVATAFRIRASLMKGEPRGAGNG